MITYWDAKSNLRPDISDMKSSIEDLKSAAITSGYRWAFWKSYDTIVVPFLQDTVDPKMFTRFVKVQEQVMRLAHEDIHYLPEAARVLAAGSPAEIEFLRKRLDEVFCKFSATFATTAWPLPERFNTPPFKQLLPTPDSVCN